MYSLRELYEDIAEGMSLERVHKKYGGFSIYITKIPPHYKEGIIKEFDGANHLALAHKYNVSKKTVYSIIKEHREKKKISSED